jgi:DEAD/DEAH box helicase domain-containing protein
MKNGFLVFDLETKKSFEEIGSRKPQNLGVSVCCLYEYETNRYSHFLESELGKMENNFLDAQLIIGFNIKRFDLPVLQPYFSSDVEKLRTFDILEDLTERLGHRISLDSLAQATLGLSKTASGLEAIRFYREQQWDKLKSYCENDVKITKEIFEYGLEKGELFFLSREGSKKLSVKVDWEEKISFSPQKQEPIQYKLL